MKKILLTLIMTLCLLLTACSTEINSAAGEEASTGGLYDIHFLYSLNEAPGMDIPGEYIDLLSDHESPETITTEFEGEEYSGRLVNTVDIHNGNFVMDLYDMDDGFFAVDHDTGELVSFMPNDYDMGIKEEDREAKAFELAGKYIDTDEYTFSHNSDSNVDKYTFEKKIKDKKTAANLQITFRADGRLHEFYNEMTRQIDEAIDKYGEDALYEIIAKLDTEEADAEVEKLLEESFPTMFIRELYDKKLTVANDGRIGMVYSMGLDYTREMSDGGTAGTGYRVYLLLTLKDQ